MPAQQQHPKEQEIPRKMDVCQQDPLSEGEGAKTKKPPAKERPHTPQTKKKARKKKKKAAQDNVGGENMAYAPFVVGEE
ncbi:protein LIAT1 isoform X4 [Podarcis raffonei]|uniref:protein LIAT1 isoform X4 n=1 Tax=Podarcis raffonei TaxID=65483 RepID=UPI00232937EE|nr:protein LIAT1 isoform X4 [Podarcis raffonei]